MKSFVKLALAALCLQNLAPGLLSAGEEDARGRSAVRVGVVRVEEIFDQYDLAKAMRDDIKNNFERDQQAIAEMKTRIKDMMAKLQDNPMQRQGDANWKKSMLDIEKLKVDLEESQKRFNREYSKAMANYYQTVYEKFRVAVESFGKTYKFDLIIIALKTEISKQALESDNPAAIQNEILTRYVQFVGPNVDMTQYVIDEMNKRYKAEKP